MGLTVELSGMGPTVELCVGPLSCFISVVVRETEREGQSENTLSALIHDERHRF